MKRKTLALSLALLFSALAGSLFSGAVQAYTVDSISKPSVPEFSVRIVAYPYDVPAKNTTTIDQYTGKETTTTQPGYHVENKSIEIAIKNPQFTPITITEYTPVSHYWYENYVPTPIECNYTADLYYNTQVKGHFGNDNDWTSVGSSSYPPQSNAQLDSEYTVISIKAADYPNDAVLDFRVQALIGYYVPYGRNVVIFGFDFYGKGSDWSNIQTLNISEASVSVFPSPTIPNTLPSQDSTTTPDQTTTPTVDSPLQQETFAIAIFIIVAGVSVAIVSIRRMVYFRKRKL